MTTNALPDARRENILAWLRQHKRASIETLAEHFGVSGMTIHRDIAELTKSGEVEKIHGGAIWVGGSPTAPDDTTPLTLKCGMCGVAAGRMPFIVKQEDGQTRTACCPHCGLMMLRHHPEAPTVLTTDFLYGRTVSAKSAAYVVGSSVQICCAPSVLSFTCADDAERFSQGFGGTVMSYEQALKAFAHP